MIHLARPQRETPPVLHRDTHTDPNRPLADTIINPHPMARPCHARHELAKPHPWPPRMERLTQGQTVVFLDISGPSWGSLRG